MALKFGIVPGIHVLFLPLFLLLAVATALGVALWFSALNALYRDVRYVTPFLVQIWMLASPVVYPSSLIPAKWRWLYGLNPMSGVIEGFRWALTGHGQPICAAATDVGVDGSRGAAWRIDLLPGWKGRWPIWCSRVPKGATL